MTLPLLLAACTEVHVEDGHRTTAQLGLTAIDFTLPGADGLPVHLYDHFGSVVLLDMAGFF